MANPPPHFIVFVPGYMGSQLRNARTGEMVWLDIPRLLRNPFDITGSLSWMFDQMRYPNDDIVPDGILDEVVFLPPLFKLEQYGRMLEALERMGYDISGHPGGDRPAVYSFAYDWRQDNRISARKLGAFVESIERNHPGHKAILIGHSNGGIVSRWYIEKEGGKDHVARLFLMGSPWDGAPKAFQVLQDGLDVFLLRIFNRSDHNIQEKIRDAVLSFPSFYQLIPSAAPFLRDVTGQSLDPFGQSNWLPSELQRQMLLDGRRFNQELGTSLSVDTLCFFGVKSLTTTGGKVRIDARGIWGGYEWERTDEGDGTVPVRSAVHPNAHQKLPFIASHGDIYIIPPVLEKLEWELLTKYRLGVLAQAVTQNLTIHFEPQGDAFEPGEKIRMWATVQRRENAAPVYDAHIPVQLVFHRALPGYPPPPPDFEPISILLNESENEAGRYVGELVAPEGSGYYRLVAVINAPGEDPVPLEELILIEGEPDWATAESTAGAEPSDLDTPFAGEPTGSDTPSAHEEHQIGSVSGAVIGEFHGNIDEVFLIEGESDSGAGSSPSEPPAPPKVAPSPPSSEPPPPLTGGPIFIDDGIAPTPLPPAPPPPSPQPATPTIYPTSVTTSSGDQPVYRSWDEPASAPVPAAPPPPPGGRFVGAEISEHNPSLPLPLGRESTLAVFIDESAAGLRLPFQEEGLFRAGETQVKMDVLLTSPDFIIHTRAPQELRIPRTGASRNKARFDLEPRRPGSGLASAYLYKNNNFVQGLDLELNTAGSSPGLASTALPAISAIRSLGRPVENLSVLQPRDVLLIIKDRGDAFDITLVDQVVTEARLAISPHQLNGIIGRARRALLDVVYLAQDPSGIHVFRGKRPPANVTLPYQSGIDIPPEVAAETLRRLAEEGLLLYQDLFFSPSAGLEARQIGERLRTLALRSHLKLQVVSQNFFLPWGLLYLGEDLDALDAEYFLGMRHMIEHIPMLASPPVFEPEISSQPALSVSLNLDTSIDQVMGRDFVGRQLGFWETVKATGGLDLTIRQSGPEWLQAMKEPAGDQLLYFYGHALTPDENDPAGSDAASLSFAGQQKVSLRDLRLRDPQNRPFPAKPLVFINACESAELSPLFYGGFMPYFTAKGARGMIGTECEVPAVFAAEWAQRFFDRFLYREQSAGSIFLDLRRDFFLKHNNLLGLLYALYCDGDTRISPPLKPT